MGNKKANIAEEITTLRGLIEEWRARRTHQGPMPLPLWEEATRLARIHGTYPIAKILNLNYAKLYSLCGEASSKSSNKKTQRSPNPQPKSAQPSAAAVQPVQPSFVDIGAFPIGAAPEEGLNMAIELTRPDGTRLKIQHRGGSSFDVKALVGSFLEAK